MIGRLIGEKFEYGSFVFSYYRFLDRFHTEPHSWQELMEFSNYIETDSSVNRLIADSMKQEK